ncbi:MAG: hypothetical protein EXS63_04780 [Candidatus Omnitrophica bacterium]|nr:hypothetical protein [Candidatus Omnitrophota bacterium]
MTQLVIRIGPTLLRMTIFISMMSLSSAVFAAPVLEQKLSDEALLDEIQHRAFQYFSLESNAVTGLVHDHAFNNAQRSVAYTSSIAATGFGLTAYAVGIQHGWIDYRTAKEKTQRTLEFLLKQAAEEHGFFYHFMDPRTGKRSKDSELSPVDTAWLLAGALFAAEFYEDVSIRELARSLYERVDWKWMLHGGKTLALSWSPEQGFNKRRWDHYDESMLMDLLAIGSPTHPISAESWKAITRPAGSYQGHRFIASPPLFTHQYSHLWLDFRNQNDGFADYFQNSAQATLANRQFAMDQANRFSSYGPNSWGLTASNGPLGYRAYGAPPGWAHHDGTVAPTACVSSIMFIPEESMACARYLYENLGDRLWGTYGFSDAFNLDKKWFDNHVLAIDQGAMLLAIENYRSGLIWKMMSKSIPIQAAKKAVGFKEGTMLLPWPDPPVYHASYMRGGIQPDGYLKDWPNTPAMMLTADQKEFGDVKDDQDLSAEIRFAWDENALYMMAKVKDESLVASRTGQTIWQDDGLELFLDPDQDGLYWEGSHDFQIGFRGPDHRQSVTTWSWFQGGEDPSVFHDVTAAGFGYDGGYVLEAAIHWKYIHFEAGDGKTLRLSPALHDTDRDKSQAKLQWFFRSEEEGGRFVLGKIVLEPDKAKHLVPQEGRL